MPLLSHPNEKIVTETMAFLEVLLMNGNKNVQEGFRDLIKLQDKNHLFITLQNVMKKTVILYEKR